MRETYLPREPDNPSDVTGADRAYGDCRECRTCGELQLAEAVANAQRDHSRATDCRVLLRRHKEAVGCPVRGPE